MHLRTKSFHANGEPYVFKRNKAHEIYWGKEKYDIRGLPTTDIPIKTIAELIEKEEMYQKEQYDIYQKHTQNINIVFPCFNPQTIFNEVESESESEENNINESDNEEKEENSEEELATELNHLEIANEKIQQEDHDNDDDDDDDDVDVIEDEGDDDDEDDPDVHEEEIDIE